MKRNDEMLLILLGRIKYLYIHFRYVNFLEAEISVKGGFLLRGSS